MKVHWIIPLTVDTAFQFTDKNELARAFTTLGHEMTTIVAYRNARTVMDGFSKTEYARVPLRSPLRRMLFHWRMLRTIWSSKADVIMLGHSAAHLVPIALLGFLFRSHPVFTLDIRTVPVDVKEGFRGRLDVMRYKLAIKMADRFCDGLTVITPMLGETIMPMLRRLRPRIGVWTSGVNLEHFERKGPSMKGRLGLLGRKVLLYHGILSPNRGLQNAIQAMAELRNTLPELVFLIVGDGAGKRELVELASQLGLNDRVIFAGRVPYEQIPAYIRAADVAILPFPNITWWDVSSPLKLMEYLAIGVKIVATDIHAHRTVAEQTGGVLLVEDNEPRSLARAISEALDSELSVPSRDLLERTISYNSQANNLLEFFEGLQRLRYERQRSGSARGR